jgi:RNA polymerase sigma-70 factor (ECF subfamily)
MVRALKGVWKMTHEQLNSDVRSYRSTVYRLAFGCTGSRFDADDITQEVFLRLFKYEKPFSSDEHKKAFLLRVTINLCKNLHKSAWLRKRGELDENAKYYDNYGDDESILRDYVLGLKPNYRAVVYLFYYEGYSAAETARLLKISESAVTTRLNRARHILKTQLLNDREVFLT